MHHSFGNNKRRWCSVYRLCLRQELLWYNNALNACLVFAFLTFKEEKNKTTPIQVPVQPKSWYIVLMSTGINAVLYLVALILSS